MLFKSVLLITLFPPLFFWLLKAARHLSMQTDALVRCNQNPLEVCTCEGLLYIELDQEKLNCSFNCLCSWIVRRNFKIQVKQAFPAFSFYNVRFTASVILFKFSNTCCTLFINRMQGSSNLALIMRW